MYTTTSTSASGVGIAASGAGAAFTGGGGHIDLSGAGLGSLPFTGVNVFFLVLTALTLVLMGVTMVRIARNATAPVH